MSWIDDLEERVFAEKVGKVVSEQRVKIDDLAACTAADPDISDETKAFLAGVHERVLDILNMVDP